MKKRLSLLTLPFLFGISTYAATTSQDLIDFADKAIQQEKITVDKFISTMQSIHEVQKKTFLSELEDGQLTKAQETINQRSQMYPLTSHLYNLKTGSGEKIELDDGTNYAFKHRANLPWMNITRGEDLYYSFPSKESFIEIQRNVVTSGATHVDTVLQNETMNYQPKYFYAGGYSLQDLSWKTLGLGITDVTPDQDLYYFFDVPSTDADYTIVVTSGSNTINLKDIYEVVSYSPEYFLTSIDDGFQFCQEVSKYIGNDSNKKEYSAQECRDAANGRFYKEMHSDILKYAASLYL